MAIKLRGGTYTEDRRLDRLIEFDPESRNYPIRSLFRRRENVLRGTRLWDCPQYLDQGEEGACVGFAFSHELAAKPIQYPFPISYGKARGIYWRAQQLDSYPGGSYPEADPFYEGTTILAGAKTITEMGYFKEYRWAFSEEDLAEAILTIGPAVIGVAWYDGMFRPDRRGFIRPTGKMQGGHAIMVHGCDSRGPERTRVYRLRNSWGEKWGVNGDCFLTARDMARLLRQQGEACIPVVRRLEDLDYSFIPS